MAAYLFFYPTPGNRSPARDADHFLAFGLDPTWAERWEHWPIPGVGPDGGQGVVYTPHGRCGYFREEQEWVDWGDCWFGRWRDKPLVPADILRPDALGSGTPTRLADGQHWLIPPARQLPCALDHDGQKWVRRVKDEYRDYWERTLGLYDFWRGAFQDAEASGEGQIEAEFGFAEQADFCTLALSLNYYLSPRIVGALGLLDDQAIFRVQVAAMQVDLLNAVDAEKKSAAEPVAIPVT